MKPEQQKNLLIILIPSTILIVAWIGFGIYNKSVKTTISQQQIGAIQPIVGTFDMSVFELLQKRQVVLSVSEADEAAPDTSEILESSLSAQPLDDLPTLEEELPPLEEGEVIN